MDVQWRDVASFCLSGCKKHHVHSASWAAVLACKAWSPESSPQSGCWELKCCEETPAPVRAENRKRITTAALWHQSALLDFLHLTTLRGSVGDHRQHLQVPPHQTSSCPAPDGSGTRSPMTTRRSSLVLCPAVHQPGVRTKMKMFWLTGQPSVTRGFTAQLMNTRCASPLEGDSPSSWQRDSGVCPPGSSIFHCPFQTSFSFPAGHGRVKRKEKRSSLNRLSF